MQQQTWREVFLEVHESVVLAACTARDATAHTPQGHRHSFKRAGGRALYGPPFPRQNTFDTSLVRGVVSYRSEEKRARGSLF